MFPRSPAVRWKGNGSYWRHTHLVLKKMMGRVKGLGFWVFLVEALTAKKSSLIILQLPKQERKPFRIVLKTISSLLFFGCQKRPFFEPFDTFQRSFRVHFRVISECLSGWLVDDVPSWFPSNHEVILSFLGWERTTTIPKFPRVTNITCLAEKLLHNDNI